MTSRHVAFAVAVLVAATTGAVADLVTLGPTKDNVLYESATGSLSNGIGEHLFAGKNASDMKRRSVLAFDVAGSVPAGATVTSAKLTLNMSRSNAGNTTVSLHRALADWGEGTSNAAGEEGGGGASTAGDATWIHRFFSASLWTVAGGDFAAGASAGISVGVEGPYTWGSTAGMVADVQSWLDAPATNFGWVLIGDETGAGTSKRFDSKNHLVPGVRPALEIEYSMGGGGAGSVPDGAAVAGTPLRLERVGTDVKLDWGASCEASDTDYVVYEGPLGNFAGHLPLLSCTTGGLTTATFTPSQGSAYYLVVPRNAAAEGSYGRNSLGAERPQSASACLSQQIACP